MKKFTHVEVPNFNPQVLDTYELSNQRFYKSPDGKKWLPSVSTIAGWSKRHKMNEWRDASEANRIELKRACERGDKLHKNCENLLTNQDMSYLSNVGPGEYNLFKTIYPFLEKIDHIACQEKCLYSSKIGLAGRTDCIANYDGEPAVIDFKGSTRPKEREWIDGYFIQATAYALMFKEMTGIHIGKFHIIVASEDNTCEVFSGNPKDYATKLGVAIQRFYADNKDLLAAGLPKLG